MQLEQVQQGFEPWGFTGSRIKWPVEPFTSDEMRMIQTQVDDLPDHALVITGGARGVDGAITLAARARGLTCVAILPDDTHWTDWEAIRGAFVVRTLLSPKARDLKVVESVKHMRVIALHESYRLPRSGTFTTARMAQRKGILERVMILRPTRVDLIDLPRPVLLYGNEICVCHPHPGRHPCVCARYPGKDCPCTHHAHLINA